jgi:hypothetical protein
VLALLLAAAGCQSDDIDPDTGLNPRPEELPSASDSPASAAPSRESCEDNALLAGCSEADEAVDVGPVTDAEGEPLPAAPSDPNGGEQDAGASSDQATLGVDAGALRAGDAGAP